MEDGRMGTHRHRRHSTELKLRLVQMYLSGEASLNGLAREHDISRNLIRVWVDKFHKGELSEKVDRAEKVREYEVKIAALERKIGQLTMEVEVLKKLRQIRSKKNDPPSVVSGPSVFPLRKGAGS
jgi:transposase-like protein